MTKYAIFIFAALSFCIACDQPKKSAPTAAPAKTEQPVANHLMITPGGGIGKVTIGENALDVIKTLGKPDGGDAAMGSQLMIWYDNHDKAGHRLSAFSHRSMGGPNDTVSSVKAVRATSPDFNTTDKLHTGSSINDIKPHFNLRRTKSSGVTIYTDSAAGIAFEVDAKDNCTAIVVFARGGLADTYLNMRE